MTDASALIAFINARLDEDVEVAQAACWDDQSDVWTASPPRERYEQYIVEDYLGDGVVVVTPENADDDGVGQHIARHDPARALREVAAKRRIVDLHKPTGADYDGHRQCLACGGFTILPPWGERGFRQPWPCETLRLLALPYSDHPDYRQEWAL